MTENKLYAQCREEARKQLCDKLSLSATIITIKYADELSQLTAEIYGMKLLDMSQPDKVLGFMRIQGHWFNDDKNNSIIGSTKDLHDHFVREFNKEVEK